MKKAFIFIMFATLVLAGCSQTTVDNQAANVDVVVDSSTSNVVESVDVRIDNTTTVPKEVNIKVGGAVTFINNQDEYVNLFVDNQIIDLKADSKFTHVFDSAGEFKFTINSDFYGTVVVE